MTCFDPFQVFEVEHKPCMLLHVRVIEGRNITKGAISNFIDTPDPYVRLRIKGAPDGTRNTSFRTNEINPKWNESFTFLLDNSKVNILEIYLQESNNIADQTLGTSRFSISDLTINETKLKTFTFNEVSEVDVELRIEMNSEPTLRYSLCLCDEEKQFLMKRKKKVMKAMQDLLGERGPTDPSHVPTIGLLGSGGGFRAMVGMYGVFQALYDSGLLDCITYASTLSGSSWYLSTLYSHPDWPEKGPVEVMADLRENTSHSVIRLLKPNCVYRYLHEILRKRSKGQPVSFTDFFGYLIGETLIKDRLNTKLSDQRERVENGGAPLPLYACVNVKRDVSAKTFQEWVEFSPYEVGMMKYGTSMKSHLFGSKFFLGKLSKQFDEPPLHYIQAVCGSAYCILFNRLTATDEPDGLMEEDEDAIIRADMQNKLESFDFCDGEESSESEEECDITMSNGQQNDEILEDPEISRQESENYFSMDGEPVVNDPAASTSNGLPNDESHENASGGAPSLHHKTKQRSFWVSFLQAICSSARDTSLLSSCEGRAGVVHNPLRGLPLQGTYPISPFTPGTNEFTGIFEKIPTHFKRIFMVDAGLAFNSPYPLLLRPQRKVDIFLSFDFSKRASDKTQPFKELLLAEKWANANFVPFPPIDVTNFDSDDMKELYVFRHPTDPYCPVVLHFVLANINFKKYKKPGIPRETDEEKEFANFSVFDDPQTPYSTFNFTYSHQAFDRLSQLMEYNTFQSVPVIRDVIAECVEKKRTLPPKPPVDCHELKHLRLKSLKEKKRLHRYISRLQRQKNYDGDEIDGLDQDESDEESSFDKLLDEFSEMDRQTV